MKRPHTIARRQFLATPSALSASRCRWRSCSASGRRPPPSLRSVSSSSRRRRGRSTRAGRARRVRHRVPRLDPRAARSLQEQDDRDRRARLQGRLRARPSRRRPRVRDGDLPHAGSRIRGTDGGLPDRESVDQAIARHIGNGTKIRSVELLGWKQFSGTTAVNHISFGQGGTRIPMERDPLALYQRLFGDIASGASDQEVARAIARKRSVIDFPKGDASRLESRLRRARAREALGTPRGAVGYRDASEQRDLLHEAGGADEPDRSTASSSPSSQKLHLDVMVQAFACDLTRVGSIVLNLPSMPWLDGIGYADIHNDFAHNVDGSEPARQAMVKVHTWYWSSSHASSASWRRSRRGADAARSHARGVDQRDRDGLALAPACAGRPHRRRPVASSRWAATSPRAIPTPIRSRSRGRRSPAARLSAQPLPHLALPPLRPPGRWLRRPRLQGLDHGASREGLCPLDVRCGSASSGGRGVRGDGTTPAADGTPSNEDGGRSADASTADGAHRRRRNTQRRRAPRLQ